MAVYDFSSPWVSAVIHNTDGTKVALWTNEHQGATTLPDIREDTQNSYPWVTQASVTLPATAALPVITVQLEPPFEDGIRFLDEAFEWGRSTLHVQFGYTQGGDPVYTRVWQGLLQKPDINISADVTITLNAQGIGGYSATRQRGSATPKEGETLRAFITKIAQGPNNSRNLRVDFTEADADPKTKSNLDAAAAPYTQGNKTDHQVLYELAIIAECGAHYDNGVLRLYPLKKQVLSPPTRVFRLYHMPGGQLGGVIGQQSANNTEVMEYPVYSLNAPEMAMWLPGDVRGSVMREVSADTRKEDKLVLEDKDTPKTGEGTSAPIPDSSLPDKDDTTEQGYTQFQGDPNVTEARRTAQAAHRDFSNAGLQIEVETVGIPDMLPEEVVALYGAGNRFSGQNFKVLTIEHSVGSDGFGTRFEAVSNVMRAQEGVKAEGETNKQQPSTNPVPDNTVEAQPTEQA